MQLSAHLADNARGGASDGAHSDRGEEHRQHSADEYTDKRLHIEQIEVKAEITELIGYRVAKCGNKGDGSERCRTDGKALSGSGGGIAETVESIGALTNNLVLTGHYSYAAGIIRDGAVCVGRKCNAKRGEHADRGKSHTVQTGLNIVYSAACKQKAADHYRNNNNDRTEGGTHTERQPVNYDRCAAGLRRCGERAGRLIGFGGEILGNSADKHAADKTAEHNAPHTQHIRIREHIGKQILNRGGAGEDAAAEHYTNKEERGYRHK